MGLSELEQACWIEWWSRDLPIIQARRAYFGHETCERLMPSVKAATTLAHWLTKQGIDLTLVTPFLTPRGLDATLRLIAALAGLVGPFEVVCNDWGLLDTLCREQTCQPVIGRILAAQPADPRHGRMFAPQTGRIIHHLSGALCRVVYRPPSDALTRHLRSCWVDKPAVVGYFMARGIRRCELSSLPQGLVMERTEGFSYSLHVPEVLLCVARECPGAEEDFNDETPCVRETSLQERVQVSDHCAPTCARMRVPWSRPDWSVELYRRGNALYYLWPDPPANIDSLPINRVVWRADIGPS